MKLTAKILSLLLTLALVVAACGTQSDTSGTAEQSVDSGQGFDRALAEGENADAASPTAPADALGADEALGDGGVIGGQVPIDLGRDIIFTALMTVAATDVAEASSQATAIIDGFGGFLFGQDTVGLPQPRTTLVFKVQPKDFQAALEALGSVGEIRSQSVNADDVTERVVDLESRIATADASVARLRDLVADAANLDQIVALERELQNREADLESLRGSLRTIRDAVDLATITATIVEALSQPALTVNVSAYPGHEDGGLSCPGEPGLTVDEGDQDVTICYELFNAGDTPLTDFTLIDPVVDLAFENMTVVFGGTDGAIEPGESIMLAAEISPERRTRTQTRITATPVDADGQALSGRTISNTSSMVIDVVDPGGLPGFSDGLSGGLELLQVVWSGAQLFAGFALALTPLLVLIGGLIFWRRRRTDAQPEDQRHSAPVPPPTPTPDAAPNPDVDGDVTSEDQDQV